MPIEVMGPLEFGLVRFLYQLEEWEMVNRAGVRLLLVDSKRDPDDPAMHKAAYLALAQQYLEGGDIGAGTLREMLRLAESAASANSADAEGR